MYNNSSNNISPHRLGFLGFFFRGEGVGREGRRFCGMGEMGGKGK